MMPRYGNSVPGPELLTAYADGALDRDASLAPFKKQVEDWLAAHPEARADVDEQRRLLDLWQQTTPREPEPAAWAGVLVRLESAPREASLVRGRRFWGKLASFLIVTAAAVWLALSLFPRPDQEAPSKKQPQAGVPFEVASAEEIEILSVEGADTNSLVVGEVPVRGPMEILGPGELVVTSVQPADHDNMVPDVRQGPATPMIWAHVDSEK